MFNLSSSLYIELFMILLFAVPTAYVYAVFLFDFGCYEIPPMSKSLTLTCLLPYYLIISVDLSFFTVSVLICLICSSSATDDPILLSSIEDSFPLPWVTLIGLVATSVLVSTDSRRNGIGLSPKSVPLSTDYRLGLRGCCSVLCLRGAGLTIRIG